jgi:4-amino-4-deoxy-L-arabinose transferase-like glycosyltransferase
LTFAQRFRTERSYLTILCLVLIFGTFLRLPPAAFAPGAPLHGLAAIHPEPGFKGIGFDEGLYRGYVDDLVRYGFSSYPDLAERYVVVQTRLPSAILPPTRFLYVFLAYLWHEVFGSDAIGSLHNVSSLFSVLLLFLGTGFAWRLGGSRVALWVAALMSCAPTQIHMSQHALIDGFFAFWVTAALWLLWENLRRPNASLLLGLYAISLALLVLTKENAMFAYLGLLMVLALNRWLCFGTITPALLGTTVLGPLAGVVVLVFLCGGADTFIHIYRLLVAKASVLPYAIATGDGPWYRYLVDLLLMSPIVFLLAWGALFRLRLGDKASLYLVTFIAGSYVVMCNIRYGMNLRYTNMWDLPLRYLAVSSLAHLSDLSLRNREVVMGIMVALLCAFDLRQYHTFFVQNDLYELVTGGLLHALQILK